ncbi:MAG: hypothetical protein JWQ96_99 [Segetibacter sp.]|nr:hypothetical protein [Segetibacter sp.]
MTKKILVASVLLGSIAFTAFKNSSKFSPSNFAASIADITKPVVADSAANAVVSTEPVKATLYDLYNEMDLGSKNLNKQAFTLAVNGYQKLKLQGKLKNDDILTIADFSQKSTQKRLYIIDIKKKKLLFNSVVAHGRNTGLLTANSFSNTAESFKSSPGFYVTAETYNGKHGMSLRLDGMERNINDNARDRAIVMHGADYTSNSFIKSTGYLGRSYGCPAIPMKLTNDVIKTIRNGSCMFIYAPDKTYLKQSSLI